MARDKHQPRNISHRQGEYRERHSLSGLAPPNSRGLSLLQSSPSDELATSIQASVAEVAVMWILHNWSYAREHRVVPLDQKIKNFSTAALVTIAAHCPMLRNAKQGHLWLIYLKGLLAADTHPREQMIAAIKALEGKSWIHASSKMPVDAPAKSAAGNLSDQDALEHISEALAAN